MGPSRGELRIGCSGWSYDDWRRHLYPVDIPRRRWFEYYANVFDTVELNATFYRLPTVTTVEAWAEAAPPGFVYAAKLGAFGSHRMKLRDAASWLPNHLDRIDRLGEAMGPTLVHLPPRWRKDVLRLDEFLSVAPERYRWAVELRDPSWLDDDVFEVLARHRAALCLHDLLPDHPMIRTTDWTYLRFHGPDALAHPYRGRYGAERLAPLAELLDGWLADGTDVYGYFNNDIEASAVGDALWLRDNLQSRLAVAP